MPNSLWDMFQPQDAAGQPASLGDAFTSRSNSLIGLGLGLLAPSNPLRGQSSWGQALEGFQGGAQIDARTAAAAAQLKQHRADQKRAQDNADRAFKAGQQSPFSKVAADLDLKPGTPEYLEAARQYHQPKTDPAWEVIQVPDPNDPDNKIPMWANKRTQEMKPLQLGQGGATAATSATNWSSGAGNAPVYGQGGGGFSAPSAAGAPAGPADLPPRTGSKAFEPEQKLRKEFEDVAKPYIVARQAFTKMQASQDNAAGDIALIFGYMKMLDPPSTVREGEFATAQNSGGIEDRIRNTYNKLLSGERLTPQQREQFKGQGAAVWQQYNKEYQPRIQQFQEIAKRYRIDPRNVIPDLGPDPVVPDRAAPVAPMARQDTQRIPVEGGMSRPSSLPKGSAFSPSLGVWRTPDGIFFDQNGRRYPDQSKFQGQ